MEGLLDALDVALNALNKLPGSLLTPSRISGTYSILHSGISSERFPTRHTTNALFSLRSGARCLGICTHAPRAGAEGVAPRPPHRRATLCIYPSASLPRLGPNYFGAGSGPETSTSHA